MHRAIDIQISLHVNFDDYNPNESFFYSFFLNKLGSWQPFRERERAHNIFMLTMIVLFLIQTISLFLLAYCYAFVDGAAILAVVALLLYVGSYQVIKEK